MSSVSQGESVIVNGRIVWVSGDLFKGEVKTDFNSKQPKLDPTTGLPQMQWAFGLAIPVSVAQLRANQSLMAPGQPGHFFGVMLKEAMSLYPSGNLPPGFAMKYKDGDSDIDQNGVSYAQREGYAGCIVLTCSTMIAPRFFRWEPSADGKGTNIQVNEGIKCGDWVNVQLSIKAHGAIGQGKPGLYMNPMAVQLTRVDKAIVTTVSGDQVFGAVQPQGMDYGQPAPQMPAFAQPAQPMSFPGMQPQQPAMPAMPAAPQGFAQPAAAPAPQPHYGVLPQNMQPQQPAVPQAFSGPTGVPAQPMGFPGMQPQQPVTPAAPQGFPQTNAGAGSFFPR